MGCNYTSKYSSGNGGSSEFRFNMQEGLQQVQMRRTYFGSRQYIPLKLNASGVMPIIFAQALMFAPAYIGGAIGRNNSRAMDAN